MNKENLQFNHHLGDRSTAPVVNEWPGEGGLITPAENEATRAAAQAADERRNKKYGGTATTATAEQQFGDVEVFRSAEHTDVA